MQHKSHFRFIRSSEQFALRSHTCAKLKNVHKFESIYGHSDLVTLCAHQVKYEHYHISMRGNCRKKEEWLPFKNIYKSYFMCICILGAYVHIKTRYSFYVQTCGQQMTMMHIRFFKIKSPAGLAKFP